MGRQIIQEDITGITQVTNYLKRLVLQIKAGEKITLTEEDAEKLEEAANNLFALRGFIYLVQKDVPEKG